MSAMRLADGSGELIRRMSSSLQAEPKLGAELVSVHQTASQVRLGFRDGSSEDCDRAILTLPPPALTRIEFAPPLLPVQASAFASCRMSPIVKIALEFKTAWWRESGWDGAMQCDRAIQQSWDGGRGLAPVLSLYICGRAAQALSGRADAIERALDDLESLFSGCRQAFVRGWMHDWILDPWAGGGFCKTAPGFVMAGMALLAEPHGRVSFAGEHTASWMGFIEGALESAERASIE